MYDMIVIGGGPAGASAALEGASLGLRVLLIEKEMFPRYKPCGGALSERARSYLGFRIPDEVIDAEVSRIRVFFRDRCAEISRSERLSTLVTRSVFDEMLVRKAEEAGAEVLLGRKATEISEMREHVRIRAGATYDGRLLVLADGHTGILSRKIRRGDGITGVCLVSDVAVEDTGDCMEIHFGEADMGYAWVFPHGSYLSVGAGGLNSSKIRGILEGLMRSRGFRGKIHGHTIPLSGPSRYLGGGRTMLCGDSADMVDPFTGEGIAYAVRSGQIAAQVASEHLSDGCDLVEYQRRCKNEFGDDLRASFLLARIMHRFPDQLFNIFMDDRSLLERYIDIHAHGLSYRSFLKWLAPRAPAKLIASMISKMV
ncbi:MAG: geranylgeranyl reductase family protein [Methanothrix sp.]|nr:geranylgeranyl reductase family protein [Methanothrix sp.]MCX8207564.1 geranylgeranyl reductase family protein [Methanothrix sp.]